MRILSWILRYYRKYWLATSVAYACLVLTAAIDLVIPHVIRLVFDCGIRVGASLASRVVQCPSRFDSMSLVSISAIAIVILTVLKGLFHFGQGYLGEYGAQGVAYDLRNDIYGHLQRLSFSWHDRAKTGQLMTRATNDVEQLRSFTSRAFLHLAHFVFMAVGITVILSAMNWRLALASLLTLPLLSRTVNRYIRHVRPLFRQAQQELALLAGIVQENLAGARVVRAFAREADELKKFERQNDLLLEQYLKAAKIQAQAHPLMDVIANLGTVIVLWLGGYLVIRGELSVGQLIAFNAYLLLIVRPVRRLGFILGHSSRAISAAERIFDLLQASIDVKDRPNAHPLPPIRGRVRLDHVWCSYGNEPVLQDVAFEANPGEVIALLGSTGSGKTTVINLIPRFYDVSGGRVLIDGHDVRDVTLLSLRRQIGIVMQDATLFSGTIRENIAFGVPGATDERIAEVAMAAHAHDFIREFPDGYDTLVGERGVTLSGGQKQRVTIARALLTDPKILILDDFTSSLDLATEALVREALENLMRDRTTFVIAQRISTVQGADQIIVLDQGAVVGMGSHEELLETNSIYSEIVRLQLMEGNLAGTHGFEATRPLDGSGSTITSQTSMPRDERMSQLRRASQ
jgi:ATP-binding cassette subfamily B protein